MLTDAHQLKYKIKVFISKITIQNRNISALYVEMLSFDQKELARNSGNLVGSLIQMHPLQRDEVLCTLEKENMTTDIIHFLFLNALANIL